MLAVINSIRDFFQNYHSVKLKNRAQFYKLILLCAMGFSVRDFINYDFDSKSIANILREYIPYYKRQKYRGNNDAVFIGLLKDKYQTIKRLHSSGLPTTKVLFLIMNGDIYTIDDETYEMKGEADYIKKGKYVLKPVNQRWGIGIQFIEVEQDILFSELIEIQRLIRENKNQNYLIEKEIFNHSKLECLSTSSLNTLRIVTVNNQEDIKVIFACVRFSSNNSRIDNWSSGGYAANIDIMTGIAQPAMQKYSDSNTSFNEISNGLLLPYFKEAKEIAIAAHTLFKPIKSIGWDIAITANGPVITEGNEDWGVILPQKLLQKGIKKLLYA